MSLSPQRQAVARSKPDASCATDAEEPKPDPRALLDTNGQPLKPTNRSERAYEPPGNDKTRDEYHQWYVDAQEGCDVDIGGEGLKNAAANFESSWYVAAALTMTVGFAFLMLQPKGQYPGSVGDDVAKYSFLALSLLGTINSVLGVWWAGHLLPQVYWHPAKHYSKFWYASLNTTLGHSQQFAKIAIEQLVLALMPLCYLNFGIIGLILAAISLIYLYLQLRTWKYLMGRMRAKYKQGLDGEKNILEELPTHFIAHDHCKLCVECWFPQYCRAPHVEGLLGWLTCQLLGTACFSFRWLQMVNMKPKDDAPDASNDEPKVRIV